MTQANPTATGLHYGEYSRLLRQLHALIRGGRGDSPEADEIRDQMDEHWQFMGQEEVARARGLSADLNTIGRSKTPLRHDEEVLDELREAEQGRDWERILHLLRENPDVLQPHEAAYARGKCWAELGDLDTCLVFLEEQARLKSEEFLFDNIKYWSLLFSALLRIGKVDEATRLAIDLADRAGPAIPEPILYSTPANSGHEEGIGRARRKGAG